MSASNEPAVIAIHTKRVFGVRATGTGADGLVTSTSRGSTFAMR